MLHNKIRASVGAMLPFADFPKPTSNATLSSIGLAIGGLLLTVIYWLSIISIILALGQVILKRRAGERQESFKWLLASVAVFIVVQAFDILVPAVADVMKTPLDSLR